jgi:hypothetical protein
MSICPFYCDVNAGGAYFGWANEQDKQADMDTYYTYKVSHSGRGVSDVTLEEAKKATKNTTFEGQLVIVHDKHLPPWIRVLYRIDHFVLISPNGSIRN